VAHVETAAETAETAAAQLLTCSWLMDAAACRPAAVRAEYLAACHAVFELDRAAAAAITGVFAEGTKATRAAVVALQATCAAACAMAASRPLQLHCPGDVAWRKWTARLRCELGMYGAAKAEAGVGTTEMSAALSDAAYEGRNGALNALLQVPLAVYAPHVDVAALRAQLVARLPHEPDHECVQTTLRVLSCWEAADPASASAADNWEEWDVMRALADSKHLRVQQQAVRCLGDVMRRLLAARDTKSSPRWPTALCDWENRLRRYSEPRCSDSLREAVACALESSGLLTTSLDGMSSAR
jgi:hypothetical protein